jgi:hypothetical protein
MPTRIEDEAAMARIEEMRRRADIARRVREPAQRNGSPRPSRHEPRGTMARVARRLKLA